MQIDRAKFLAKENGYELRQGQTQWDMELFQRGCYIDTLATAQILHLQEEDFVEFYLEE